MRFGFTRRLGFGRESRARGTSAAGKSGAKKSGAGKLGPLAKDNFSRKDNLIRKNTIWLRKDNLIRKNLSDLKRQSD